MGRAAHHGPPLRRHLFRHPRRAQRRGRRARRAGDSGDDRPGRRRRRAARGRPGRHDRRLLHLPVARPRRAGAGRRRAAVRLGALRRGAPHHGRRAPRRPDLAVRAGARRRADTGRPAALHDRDAAPLHRGREDEGGPPPGRRVFDGRRGGLRAGVPPAALLEGRRTEPAVRLPGRRARHVGAPRRGGSASASGRGGRRDQPRRRDPHRRLLARLAEPGPAFARRFRSASDPRDRLHEHHPLVEAAGGALGRHRRAGREATAGGGAGRGVPLRDPPRRRPAPRARPQGAHRMAEGRVRRGVPHPVERPLPVRGHRRAGPRRGAVHESAQQPGGHRAGRGAGHAQGPGQDVRLRRAAGRGARGRRPGRRARRQRAVRGRLGGAARAALARRQVRCGDQPDRPERVADRPHHHHRSRDGRRGGAAALPGARPAAGRHLREDRRQVRRPEVLGDLGPRRRRDLRASRAAHRRTARPAAERGARRLVRRLSPGVEGFDQHVDHPGPRHRHDGAARADAARLRGAVRGLRLRRGQSRGPRARRAARRLRRVRARERDARPRGLLRERAAAGARARQQRGAPARADGAVREVLLHRLEEGGRPARHRLHAGRDRRLHPPQRGTRPETGVRPRAERRGRARAGPVHRHRHLPGPAAAVRADPRRRPDAEVPRRAARERDRAARLLHRGRARRRGVPRPPRGRRRLRAVPRHRADRHVQPAHRTDQRLPDGLAARQQRARRAAAEDADPRHRGQSALVGGAAQRDGRQPQRGLPRDGAARRRHVGRALDGDAQEQPVRHLQDGDPLGVGPHRRAGRRGLRHQRVVDRRPRRLRGARVSGRGVQQHLGAEPAGEPADAGRAVAA